MATGLAVTFMVTNRLDRSQLVETMEWEKKFVDFMKAYENPLFDFAFSSERSIEDGIQELSDGEMGTVIISYVVMFVYVTISLGKFKGIRSLLVSESVYTQLNSISFWILCPNSPIDGEQGHPGHWWNNRRLGSSRLQSGPLRLLGCGHHNVNNRGKSIHRLKSL